jgi:hypothetical protein
MSKPKIYGFVQPPDPSGQASYLMTHRKDALHVSRIKRSSPRVKAMPQSYHPVSLTRGYRDRITLPKIWEKKP